MISKLSLYLISLSFIWACTENPFADNKISGGKRQVSGSISLKDGANPEGVVVWLQNNNIMTASNDNGDFTIFLPPKISGGITGVIEFDTLYFYLANYILEKTPVLIANGEFLYAREAINNNGKLIYPIQLQRFMQITTVVTPPSIPKDYSDKIEVIVNLQADNECDFVLNPKIIEKNVYSLIDILGAILVKNLVTDEVIIVQSNPNANGNEVLFVCKEPIRRRLTFTLSDSLLKPGRYEIIPYLLMNLDGVPEGLVQQFEFHIDVLNVNYLKIPMRREGGQFLITM